MAPRPFARRCLCDCLKAAFAANLDDLFPGARHRLLVGAAEIPVDDGVQQTKPCAPASSSAEHNWYMKPGRSAAEPFGRLAPPRPHSRDQIVGMIRALPPSALLRIRTLSACQWISMSSVIFPLRISLLMLWSIKICPSGPVNESNDRSATRSCPSFSTVLDFADWLLA
jgi:hypothetical protein